MQKIKFAFSTILLMSLVIVLSTKIGSFPPLGKVLHPFIGVWQNVETDKMDTKTSVFIKTLHGQVDVVFDTRGVPHLFAADDDDLYFAQGYVTARDRLWQMDFQSRLVSGRLAEIFGSKVLDFDRFQRRMGLVYGAQKAVEKMRRSPKTWSVIQAYSAGINAYIESLDPAAYPLEYKLLDYAPESWTPLHCALLVKYMAWNLTGYSSDLALSQIAAVYGQQTIDELFPAFIQGAVPVIPADTQWDFEPLNCIVPAIPYVPYLESQQSLMPMHGGEVGSNNWAVAARKTAAGYPLLANDPHLQLLLPSFWYEIQLQASGVNTYGVSIPGIPGVVIGFNEEIAWGVTNGGDDVLDWYKIDFEDENLRRYRYDDAWRPVRRVVEKIQVRGAASVADTVLYTHHGPVVWHDFKKNLRANPPLQGNVPPGLAVRWIGHEPSDEIGVLYKTNRAADYDEFITAIANFISPAQNFVFADQQGDIAVWHQGLLPAKWRGQGMFVGDGSDPLHAWQGWIPQQQNPHSINPPDGFVASANQHPTTASYPYPWSWRYAYYRGKRLNQQLGAMENITPEDFKTLQLDNKHLLAVELLPILLDALEREILTQEQQQAVTALAGWDFMYDADKLSPTLFDAWWECIYRNIWQDEFGLAGEYPTAPRTVQLIKEEPHSIWFDDQQTVVVEDCMRIIQGSFFTAWSALQRQYGPWGESWKWGMVKGTRVRHLLGLPGLSSKVLMVGGGTKVVNATGRVNGPSWRMVVELGSQVRGWGIYPGGQSGNPGSRRYDDFIETWSRGELAELIFLRELDMDDERLEAHWVLEGNQ